MVAVYKKVNGHWVAQDNYDFDNTAYFYESGEISVDVFLIVADDSYSGQQFYVIAKLNNTQVNPTWSITSGNHGPSHQVTNMPPSTNQVRSPS